MFDNKFGWLRFAFMDIYIIIDLKKELTRLKTNELNRFCKIKFGGILWTPPSPLTFFLIKSWKLGNGIIFIYLLPILCYVRISKGCCRVREGPRRTMNKKHLPPISPCSYFLNWVGERGADCSPSKNRKGPKILLFF